MLYKVVILENDKEVFFHKFSTKMNAEMYRSGVFMGLLMANSTHEVDMYPIDDNGNRTSDELEKE
jgi:hypothetical protein